MAVFDEVERESAYVLGVLPRLTKARALVEAPADAVVSLDRHCQTLETLFRTFCQSGLEQPRPDPAALPRRQHVNSSELRRLRRSAYELREPDDITTRFGYEKTRSRRRERAAQALPCVPVVEQPALDFLRNDAGVDDRPRCPGDGLHLRDIRRLGAPDDHTLMGHVAARYRNRTVMTAEALARPRRNRPSQGPYESNARPPTDRAAIAPPSPPSCRARMPRSSQRKRPDTPL